MTCRNCAKNIYNGGGCPVLDNRYADCPYVKEEEEKK